MKKTFFTILAVIGMAAASEASLFYQGDLGGIATSGGTSEGSVSSSTIVDGNPAIIIANSMDLSSAGLGPVLSSLTVSLNLTGGQNNGLYAWLVGPDNSTVTLMNQPGVSVDGVGALGSGMNLTLFTSGAANGPIQSTTSGSALSGSYNSAASFSGFTGSPNGTWTLYFSDTLKGGGDASLNGWSLDITAVPEPTNVALGIFGVVAGGILPGRWLWRQKFAGR